MIDYLMEAIRSDVRLFSTALAVVALVFFLLGALVL